MLEKLRGGVTFANVTSLLALFVALGGTSYAIATGSIGSREIRDNSIRSQDVRNHTLTQRDIRRNSLGSRSIRESRLGPVRRARNADRLGGLTAADLKVRCPEGSVPISDVCVETTPRPAQSYGSASVACEDTDRPASAGRRLPTHAELVTSIGDFGIALAPEGELTANVYPDATVPTLLNVLFVTTTGGIGLTPNTGAGAKPFRCVSDPSN